MLEEIRNLLLDLADVEEVKKVISEELASGADPMAIIDILNETLNEVGEKYERGDLFLSELMMIGYLAREITDFLKPSLVGAEMRTRGKVVFGTVKGDIHDIGKNITIMLLQSAGFEVVDLGVDVTAEKFLEAVKEEAPDVLAMSALLTSTMGEMKAVLDALEERGLRGGVKVIVGGRPITGDFAREIGADAYAEDAAKAVRVIGELMRVKENE